MPNRLYNDQEVSAVLKKAAELQQAEGPTDAVGLSLKEMQQIAQEVGINPSYIELAVAQLQASPEQAASFQWLGAPHTITQERVVEGEISESDWEDLVGEVRRVYKSVGTVGKLSHTMEWTDQDARQQREHHVSVTPKNGKTKIRVHDHFPSLAIISFVPGMVVALQVAIVMSGVLQLGFGAIVALFASLLGSVFFLLRFIFSRVSARQQRKADQIVSAFEQLMEARAEATAALPASQATEKTPAVSLEDTALAETDTVAPARRQQTR